MSLGFQTEPSPGIHGQGRPAHPGSADGKFLSIVFWRRWDFLAAIRCRSVRGRWFPKCGWDSAYFQEKFFGRSVCGFRVQRATGEKIPENLFRRLSREKQGRIRERILEFSNAGLCEINVAPFRPDPAIPAVFPFF